MGYPPYIEIIKTKLKTTYTQVYPQVVNKPEENRGKSLVKAIVFVKSRNIIT